jgi:hypothetical protein
MPDTKQKSFAESLLKKTGRGPSEDEAKSFTSERQHTAQAFNLHVERRDGRRSEGFSWSHYSGYQWTDDGDHERLIVVFGGRALEIEGHNLGVLVAEIREGQLNSIKEMTTGHALLLQEGVDKEPVISSVKMYQDFEEILKEIKGEDNETRHTRRLER